MALNAVVASGTNEEIARVGVQEGLLDGNLDILNSSLYKIERKVHKERRIERTGKLDTST